MLGMMFSNSVHLLSLLISLAIYLQLRKWRFRVEVRKFLKAIQMVSSRARIQKQICQTAETVHLHCPGNRSAQKT